MHTPWLQWYYVIYWLPFGLATGILLMSGLGGHHAGHSAAGHHGLAPQGHGLSGHAPAHSAAGHAATGHAPAHTAASHSPHQAPAGSHPHNAVANRDTAETTLASPAMQIDSAPHDAAGIHAGIHTFNEQSGREVEAHLHIGSDILGFFGFGRAPLTILIGSLMIGWGLTGIIATQAFQADFHQPDRFILPAFAVAIAGAIIFTKLLGELFARMMVKDESYAIHREDLIGLTGTVVYPVSESGGRIHVFDQYRTLHVEPARMRSGSPPVSKGAEVLVIGLDSERGCLLVDAMKVEEAAAV